MDTYIKVKSRRNKLSLSGTGGGQSNYCSLTPLEERVSELLAFNTYIQGMSNTSRYGAPASTSAIGNIEEKDEAIGDDEGIETNGKALDLDCTKQSSNNILSIHTPSSSSRDLFNKQTLLQKQVENQIKYQENSIELLRQCNDNQKALMEQLKDMNNNLSSANKYLKRNSDLKERMYKLKKEKFEFYKKNEMQKTKCKLEKLELKKKMFELESQNNMNVLQIKCVPTK